jgi:predicted lipoprotein
MDWWFLTTNPFIILSMMILNSKFKKILFSFSLLTLLSACGGGSDDPDPSEELDRQPILINWVDNIVLPSYELFKADLDDLNATADAFVAEPNMSSLMQLRISWADAYVSWETVELFDFGPGYDRTLRNFMNIYPTDVAGITTNIDNPTVNLALPANYARQGFPALDYLINGVAETDQQIVSWYTDATSGQKRIDYLVKLIDRITTLTTSVLNDWATDRAEFIEKTGLDIGSSMGQVVNAYVLHFERYIRSGKVGIPSGAAVASAGVPHPEKIESYYKRDHSFLLLITAHRAMVDFFNGQKVMSSAQGPSLKSYLDALGAKDQASGQMLSDIINDQFEVIEEKIDLLQTDLYQQIVDDNDKMIDVHTEMQAMVRLLKVDMTSAMSITITYTDNDGD